MSRRANRSRTLILVIAGIGALGLLGAEFTSAWRGPSIPISVHAAPQLGRESVEQSPIIHRNTPLAATVSRLRVQRSADREAMTRVSVSSESGEPISGVRLEVRIHTGKLTESTRLTRHARHRGNPRRWLGDERLTTGLDGTAEFETPKPCANEWISIVASADGWLPHPGIGVPGGPQGSQEVQLVLQRGHKLSVQFDGVDSVERRGLEAIIVGIKDAADGSRFHLVVPVALDGTIEAQAVPEEPLRLFLAKDGDVPYRDWIVELAPNERDCRFTLPKSQEAKHAEVTFVPTAWSGNLGRHRIYVFAQETGKRLDRSPELAQSTTYSATLPRAQPATVLFVPNPREGSHASCFTLDGVQARSAEVAFDLAPAAELTIDLSDWPSGGTPPVVSVGWRSPTGKTLPLWKMKVAGTETFKVVEGHLEISIRARGRNAVEFTTDVRLEPAEHTTIRVPY